MWDSVKDILIYHTAEPLLFSSGLFLWLFTGFYLVYALLRHKDTARLLFVLLFSYYFYYKSSGIYFFLLAIVTVSDFLIALFMDRTKSGRGRKCLVALSLVIDLGLLCYFKYTNFFVQVIASFSC